MNDNRSTQGAADGEGAGPYIRLDAPIIAGASDGRLQPGAGRTQWFRDHVHGPEMVIVPAGSFTMGSPGDEPEREPWQQGTEGPQHEVAFAEPFAVARLATTRGEFATFVEATGYRTEPGALSLKGGEWLSDPEISWRDPGFEQSDAHPVVCVSWDDARAYAAWLGQLTGQSYRLLSEAEWEYATRTGSSTPFWWGPAITPSEANYDGSHVYAGGGRVGEFRRATMPAMSFAPNPWGLFNVHGNVWEWCEDVWHESYSDAPADGSAWLGKGGGGSSHVLRGGSWINQPRFLRSAVRFGYSADVRSYNFGFRLARALVP